MSRPRGRPREYDPQIALDAAMAVFWERGFAATSLTDLCKAMGMNRPSLYAAFGDKRAIFHQALQRYEARMSEQLGEPLARNDDPRLGLTEFFFEAIDVYLSGDPGHRGCMIALTATVESGTDAEARELALRTIGHLEGLLTEYFRRTNEGREDAARRGSLATALLHSLAVRARAGHGRRALRKLARDGVALLVEPDASDS